MQPQSFAPPGAGLCHFDVICALVVYALMAYDGR